LCDYVFCKVKARRISPACLQVTVTTKKQTKINQLSIVVVLISVLKYILRLLWQHRSSPALHQSRLG
jgi:hypothetical protein